MMRLLALSVLLGASALLQAEDGQLPPPPKLPPLPDQAEQGPLEEPSVRIIQRKDATIQEFRLSGRLYMVKVVPVTGPAYYLVDHDGDGSLETRHSELDQGVVVPTWVLFRW